MMGFSALSGMYLILMYFSAIQTYVTKPVSINTSGIACNTTSLVSVILAVRFVNYFPRVKTLFIGATGIFISNCMIAFSLIFELEYVSLVFW